MTDAATTSADGASASPSLEDLQARAREMRRWIVKSTTQAGSGHPSSSMSATEILVALYFGGILRYDPDEPGLAGPRPLHHVEGPRLARRCTRRWRWPATSRSTTLMTLRHIGSPLEGHPNMRRLPGVEASTGSLGQGLSIGSAWRWRRGSTAAQPRLRHARRRRDRGGPGLGGGHERRQVQARQPDRHRRSQRLSAEPVGRHRHARPSEPLLDKWRAFGWNALEIDGHDVMAVIGGAAPGAGDHGPADRHHRPYRQGQGRLVRRSRLDLPRSGDRAQGSDRALAEIG